MLYNAFKIAHIITATLLLTSMAYCFFYWKKNDISVSATRIQMQTSFIIIPVALLQLITGFTLFNLSSISSLWIVSSLSGYIVTITSWFGFLSSSHRSIQARCLVLCSIALIGLIFLMTNKKLFSYV